MAGTRAEQVRPNPKAVLEQGEAPGTANKEHQSAPARPSISAALAKRRRRRRRRQGSGGTSGDSSGDTSEGNDDTRPGYHPPLHAAPVEGAGQGQLLLLGKKRINVRRLHVGSHAWHKRMDQKGAHVRRIFSVVDVRRIFQSWKELTRSRMALQTVMAFQDGLSSFTSRQNTQYVS
jgi:hypothetical protein